MAGLPGSGLGGLFYILLLLWVFVRQAFAGSLAPARFKDMIPLAGMAVAMVAALAVAAWLVARAFGPLPTFASLLAPSDRTGRWALILGITPIICIMVMLCGIRLARLAVPRRSA
jgi:hypothetical protein